MAFNYPDRLASLSPNRRLHFYELLAHNLTISIRGIWSEPDLSEAEKLNRIYLVNEILHRITAKVNTLRLKLHEWKEADSWELIESYNLQNRAIEKDEMTAINYSYKVDAAIEEEGVYDQKDA